jgi:hypothetical protein
LGSYTFVPDSERNAVVTEEAVAFDGYVDAAHDLDYLVIWRMDKKSNSRGGLNRTSLNQNACWSYTKLTKSVSHGGNFLSGAVHTCYNGAARPT